MRAALRVVGVLLLVLGALASLERCRIEPVDPPWCVCAGDKVCESKCVDVRP